MSNDWKEKRFDDFIKLNRGYDLPNDKMIEGDYPVVASTSIKGYHNSFKIKAPAVITGRSGSLGTVQFINEDCTPLNTTLYVKDFKNNNKRFVYYYLKTMHLEVFNSGAGVPTLNQNHLHGLKVKIPDLSIQNKIADILSRYDDLIDVNNKRIKLLTTASEELYKDYFIRNKNEDWEFIKLKEFGYTVETGTRPKGGIDFSIQEQDGVPSLGAESIDCLGVFNFSDIKYVSTSFFQSMKRGLGRDGDILVYKDGAYIGKVTLFMDNFPFETYCVNEHVYLLRSNNSLYQYYLYFTLNLPQYFSTMQNLNRNAAQPGLTGKDLDIIKLYKPNVELINKFNNFVEPILHEVYSIAKMNKKLSIQRDLLLPRLMAGKLKI